MRSCGRNVRGCVDCYVFHVDHDCKKMDSQEIRPGKALVRTCLPQQTERQVSGLSETRECDMASMIFSDVSTTST
jgi:hypothetical protein